MIILLGIRLRFYYALTRLSMRLYCVDPVRHMCESVS